MAAFQNFLPQKHPVQELGWTDLYLERVPGPAHHGPPWMGLGLSFFGLYPCRGPRDRFFAPPTKTE